MEEWILIIGHDPKISISPQIKKRLCEWGIYKVSGMATVDRVFSAGKKFLLVVVFRSSLRNPLELRNIRRLTDAPVIVLAEEYNGEEKISFLDAGADEYIAYPETMWEIVASCCALVRRYTALGRKDNEITRLALGGDVLIDRFRYKIFVNGVELRFAHREFDLLNLLASYPGRVFTYGQLFSQLWEADNIPTENSVHSCIRRIRRKLECIPGCPCRIENIRGVGYFFRQIEP